MSIAIFVLNSPEFQPIGAVAGSAGMAATPCGDYTMYASTQGEVLLERDQRSIRPALWFAALTGGCEGSIVRFDDRVLQLAADCLEAGG